VRAIVKEEVAAALLVVREDLQTEITQLSDRVDEVQVTASQADRQASSLQVVTSAMLKCGQAGLLPVGGTRCIPAQVPAKAPQGRSCSDLLAQGGECDGHAPVARFLSTWRHWLLRTGSFLLSLFLCNTPLLPFLPSSSRFACAHAYALPTVTKDGVYSIVGSDGKVVETYCDMTTAVSAPCQFGTHARSFIRIVCRPCKELVYLRSAVVVGVCISPAELRLHIWDTVLPQDGGWSLIGVIADEYDWICPGHPGVDCRASSAPVSDANFFASTHTRTALDLVAGGGKDSGVHLPMDTVRSLFADGDQPEIRWTFMDGNTNDAAALSDLYFSFTSSPAELFKPNSQGEYRKGTDFTVQVLKQEAGASIDADILCWGDNAGELYRAYEQGLHMGVASPTPGGECHLANDATQVQFKSHYTNSNGWYTAGSAGTAMLGFLSDRLQKGSTAIRIFVRSKPRDANAWGSPSNPGASCDDLKNR